MQDGLYEEWEMSSMATSKAKSKGRHPSHVTRISMHASSFDEICINCSRTDEVLGGWGKLADPCPKPVGKGGITLQTYEKRRRKKMSV